jgi:putative DNA methylase
MAPGEWNVKGAIREWNTNLERYFKGEIGLEQLLNSRARPIILVKVRVDGDLFFEAADRNETEKLWKALEKLKQIWGDLDILVDPFAPYQMGTAGAFRVTLWGFDRFYKLFNPRQLLTLVKLVKLIREAGKRIEQEKLAEGWSREDAFKYAEAVTVSLAVALARFVDHDNIVTLLHPSNPIGIELAHALSMRGIAMQWNWGDTNPFIVTRGLLRTNSWIKCLEKEIEGLSYLVRCFSADNKNKSKIQVLLDDATVLSKIPPEEKFNVIVTDPPYRDDVPYAELSDF